MWIQLTEDGNKILFDTDMIKRVYEYEGKAVILDIDDDSVTVDQSYQNVTDLIMLHDNEDFVVGETGKGVQS